MNNLYYYFKETVILETQNNQVVVVFENCDGDTIIYEAWHLNGLKSDWTDWDEEKLGYKTINFKFLNKYLVMDYNKFCCEFYFPDYAKVEAEKELA